MKYRFFIFWLLVFISANLLAQTQIDTIRIVNNDTIFVRYLYKNGKISKEKSFVGNQLVAKKKYYNYKDGHFDYGLQYVNTPKPRITYIKSFHKNGSLRIDGTKQNRKTIGHYRTYYENGALQCDCFFKAGKRDGFQKIYYNNSKIKFSGNYRHGREDGKVSHYYKNGQLKDEIIYDNGHALEILSAYDPEGNPIEKGTLFQGNGTRYNYDKNGKLINIDYYRRGRIKKPKEYF